MLTKYFQVPRCLYRSNPTPCKVSRSFATGLFFPRMFRLKAKSIRWGGGLANCAIFSQGKVWELYCLQGLEAKWEKLWETEPREDVGPHHVIAFPSILRMDLKKQR